MIQVYATEVAAYYAARVADIRQGGQRWRGRCPIHRGKHDSFSVDPDTGLWRCWSECGRGGDIIALEMELTGVAWREAVASIEDIIGRILLNRPASHAERREAAARHHRNQRELRHAEYWKIAAECMAEHVLEEMPAVVPERFGPTQFLLSLRKARTNVDLLALYRVYRERDPRLAAALVYAGERAWDRQCNRLARFIAAGAEVHHAA